MGLKFCLVVLLGFSMMSSSTATNKTMSIKVHEYFPEIQREISKVTWAHAVNNHEKLKNALEDVNIMMLEADIIMGTHDNFQDIQPIMGHPPSKSSDLTFVQFLEAVLRATGHEGKRKGIKLDFKELEAVEPCLKTLKSRLEEPDAPTIPIFINADILQGPVNSTKKPLDAQTFISLAREYTPFATLSIGWTTRYGTDDPSDEIREGKYTKQHMKDMLKVIRHAGDPPVFPHITFPVRAGLAAQSELLYLTGRVRTDSSVTFWSALTDPVNRYKLRQVMQQLTNVNYFIDLPFPIDGDQDDETDADVIDNPDPSISAIQKLEGRGHSEESISSGAASSLLSLQTIIPVIAVGLITTAAFVYRRF